ncbi:MAG: DUF4363 family protein [Clostridia bacterium]|nr:DUF4363 family protein [Clostridia bacterium]
MTFLRFRTVCTVLFCAGLLALFWIPQRMLMQSADEWNRAAEEAADLMRAGEYERGERVCKALYESFRDRMDALERFLNHDAVDAVLTSLREASALAEAGDAAGTLSALASAQGGIDHLVCIERFTWNALL